MRYPNGRVIRHYYQKSRWSSEVYLGWKELTPAKGQTDGNSEGTEKDAENAIRDKNKADADVVGKGQEEINKHKEDTKDYLNCAKKIIPKLPKQRKPVVRSD